MNYGRQVLLRKQFGFLRRQFLQEGDLPFTDVLSQKTVSAALDAIDGNWKDRIFTPLVTLWGFLGQVLSADHSCRAAVARLIAHRMSQGQKPCSSQTGAYCQARKRLPEKFFSAVTCMVGRALMIRETRVRVEQPGFRSKNIIIVTTLLDPEQTT